MNPGALFAALTTSRACLSRLQTTETTVHAPTCLLCLALALLPAAAARAESSWVADPGIQQRLAAGEVVMATSPIDPSHPRGRIRAAVRIRESPEKIWSIVTDCRQALSFVPGLRQCRRLDSAADGSWQDVEHVVRYSWLLPTIRYVFRCEFDRPHRIDFRRVSGDLKEEEGTWLLTSTADGSATVVEYEVYLDPGFWIPQALVTHSLRKDIPAVLSGLRACAERPGSECAAR